MIGKTLGHYHIEEKLGEGGMGVVFRARDTKLERDVALKLVSDSSTSAEAHARLLAEARAASALNHPNVATVHEVSEHEGQGFIVMELVPGRPLSQSISTGGLPADTCLRYGAQIAAALEHAHGRGVIHRDLKSANVVITPDGHAKVLDFGLARWLPKSDLTEITRSKESLRTSDAIVGTLHYMAPELLRGEPAGAQTDIWALGVILYEMAAGKLPFEGCTGFELTSAILREPPPPLPAQVPPGIRSVIKRCLAKESGQRYGSAAQVHAALEAISSDTAAEPAVAAESSFPGMLPWRRSKAVLWGSSFLAVLAFAVWKGPSLLRNGASKNEPPASHVTNGGRPSANPQANEAFERAGLFLRTRLDLPRASQQFQRALELDPNFASARAYHGFTHLQMIHQGISNDRSLLYKAEEEERQAQQLEPDLGLARGFLSGVYLYLGRKELAIQEAQKAVQLEAGGRGSSGEVWLGLCDYLSGDYPAAKNLFQKTLRNDPLFWAGHWFLSQIYIEEGQLDGARLEGQKVLDQDPGNLVATITLSYGHLTAGEVAHARADLENTRPADKENFRLRMAWALVHAREGKAPGALDPELLTYAEVNPFITISAAEYYSLRGDSASALEWLDRTVRSGDERSAWFERDPLLAGIRNQPRFQQILNSIAYRRQPPKP